MSKKISILSAFLWLFLKYVLNFSSNQTKDAWRKIKRLFLNNTLSLYSFNNDFIVKFLELQVTKENCNHVHGKKYSCDSKVNEGGQFSDFYSNLLFFKDELYFFFFIVWRHNLVIFHCIWCIFRDFGFFWCFLCFSNSRGSE